MELQVGVKAFIENPEGKYLLLQRSGQYVNLEGVFDLPGGRIEPGTGLMVNLIREIEEETGLKIDGEPVLLCAQDIFVRTSKHIVRLTYKVKVSEDKVKLSSEHTSYTWNSLDEIRKMDNLDPYTREVIQKGLVS